MTLGLVSTVQYTVSTVITDLTSEQINTMKITGIVFIYTALPSSLLAGFKFFLEGPSVVVTG
jgi:hypothetical protein